MRFSVTTDMFNYSYRLGLEEKLSLFREYGFEYIHWCDDWDNDTLYSHGELSRLSGRSLTLGSGARTSTAPQRRSTE